MTPTEYRNALAALGLTQGQAAAFLGVSHRTAAGYALGEYPVPVAAAKLLRLVLRLKLKLEDAQ